MKLVIKEDLDGKSITNIKPNQISMTPYSGKLAVLNIVEFEISAEKKEVDENDFFSNIDSATSTDLKCRALIIVGEGGVYFGDQASEWMKGTKTKFNIDKYPDEMAEIISKSINSNKDLLVTDDMTHYITQELADGVFDKQIETAKNAFADLTKQIKKYKSMDAVDLDEFLDRYAFKKHLLIQGEKGGSKTYSVDKKIVAEGYESKFLAGHEGIESIDLLGYYIKSHSGELVWLDGVLSEAFRAAKTSKTVMFMDELLRIPARELNILIGCLTPSSTGTYRLRTNRIIDIQDGIGKTELLEIPMENLWCIGTTNVGAGYNVDEADTALGDRFRTVNKVTTMPELEAILTSVATVEKKNLDIVDKMTKFYTQMRDLVDSGELEKKVNTRHLCETLQLADADDEIVSYLYDLIPTWTSMDTDGKPNKAEKDIITKLIKKSFK